MNMAVRSAEFAIPVAGGLQPRAFVPLRHPGRAPFRLQPIKAMKIWAEFKREAMSNPAMPQMAPEKQ